MASLVFLQIQINNEYVRIAILKTNKAYFPHAGEFCHDVKAAVWVKWDQFWAPSSINLL